MKLAILSVMAVCAGVAFVVAASPGGGGPASASDAAQIAAGYRHNCVLTPDSVLKCWGDNSSGQIGDGTTTERHSPTEVTEFEGGVLDFDGGDSHSCAVTSEGELKCWGRNEHGQLGIGTTGDPFGTNPTPLDVCADEACEATLSDIADVSLGDSHTCVLTTAGGVKCWGLNDHGQVGDGTPTTRSAPADVVGLTSGVVAIEAGAFHTCAVTAEGGVKCWGKNLEGQLGDDRVCGDDCINPVDVIGLTSGIASVVAAGLHTCAVTTEGGMLCWGFNFDGQLGHDSEEFISTTPVMVSGLDSGVAAAAANGIFRGSTCALLISGAVKCWGDNAYGHVGDGTTENRRAPVDVVGLSSGIAQVSVGNGHTCALTDDGRVLCWGKNFNGELGDGTLNERHTPGAVLGLKATTPIPTPTGTATPTLTPPHVGDASCDALVNSLDAALILQFTAGLLAALPCPENGDANQDGTTNSIDAQIVLQFDAGLLSSLPP